MNNKLQKAPVYLIDLSRNEDYTLLLEELAEVGTDTPGIKLSGYNFITEQGMAQKYRHRYLCITLFGQWMFGAATASCGLSASLHPSMCRLWERR